MPEIHSMNWRKGSSSSSHRTSTVLGFLTQRTFLRYVTYLVCGLSIVHLVRKSTSLSAFLSPEDKELTKTTATTTTSTTTTKTTTTTTGAWYPSYDDAEIMMSMMYNRSFTEGGRTTAAATTTTKAGSTTTTNNKCFVDHSPAWLQSRHGNTVETRIPLLIPSDANYFQEALEQSLCHEQSAFSNPPQQQQQQIVKDDDPQSSDASTDVRNHWLFRLVYWGIHLHQHEPARDGIEARRTAPTPCRDGGGETAAAASADKGIGPYDYECPDTKFLVTDVPRWGLGADVRLSVVPTLLAGLAMNRTVLLINAAPREAIMRSNKNATFLTEGWKLSGCPDRKDYQCFFLPVSPCVPSIEDLQNAVVIPGGSKATYEVQRTGAFQDASYDDARVVIVPSNAKLPTMTTDAQGRVGQRIRELIVKQVKEGALQVPASVVEGLSDPKNLEIRPRGERRGTMYDMSSSVLHAAAVLYTLRPNSALKEKVDDVLKRAVPKDFSTERSFGMPIRASDKCILESECISFDQYMELVRQQRAKYYGSSRQMENVPMDIVLTSEAADIMENRTSWEGRADFPFRFVVNEEDAQQGSGWPVKYGAQANAIMVSTIVALKLQLLSKHFVANCCSRFHEVLMDLFKNGCGASPSPTIHCMQELDDPQFRLCCPHRRTAECVQKRLEKLKKAAAEKEAVAKAT